ncbi:hypothetical protein FIV42_21780 [Persicimonas caeni]|uniref:Lipocalin-like domain-containing protein n=1 Tax=Persicimonas caeni TaxID=2292766 RepID=A0A4Y6PZ47_PERCE|nr:hypothetical protein [Persicimonas caeni]QDG53277.1 hypothetical protein FIV42_21780 [Persicimonas caeni]QED34499.1 hypothetical protein FRD00_21775 [Persicimonas caeni]
MAFDLLSRRFLLTALLVTLCSVGLVACAGQQKVPKAQPMPAGKNFTGVWYSPQFEHMHLRQTGDKVSGIFTYEEGGTIEGEVDGNLLVFKWIEPGSKEKAKRTMKGRGYLQLVQDGEMTKLKGEWGYNEQATGGGPWTAEWVRELEPEDPLTLEDLEAQRD